MLLIEAKGNYLGWLTGIEPAASAATEQRSTIELQPPRLERQGNYTLKLL